MYREVFSTETGIPGLKLGLSNNVILVVLFFLTPRDALLFFTGVLISNFFMLSFNSFFIV